MRDLEDSARRPRRTNRSKHSPSMGKSKKAGTEEESYYDEEEEEEYEEEDEEDQAPFNKKTGRKDQNSKRSMQKNNLMGIQQQQ